jgi:pimeloyl-ACP methyl ester carboxylesterase
VSEPNAPRTQQVIVLHGIWMAGPVCGLLAHRLRGCGFDVAIYSYPSVRLSLDENARGLQRYAEAGAKGPVHFVAHSLGGLVVLAMLASKPSLEVGRIVLLGSPCAGSSTAEQLARKRPGRWLLGQALGSLVPGGSRPLPNLEIGAIAGTRRFGVGMMLARLNAPNDGVVTVAETHLPGLADHVVLPVTHSGMLFSARVARQVCAFLRLGRFTREPRAEPVPAQRAL